MNVAGVDIGGTSVKMGVLRQGEGLIWQKKIPSVAGDPQALSERIAGALRECPYPYECVGVGTAGAVRLSDNTVTASNLRWVDVPLRSMLERAVGCPVWVDNDAQVALAAEVYDGACKGATDVVYLTLGTGIGGALLIGGKPWRGPDHTGGEMGHIITHANGRKCSCGRRGCFETYASASSLARMAHRSTLQVMRAVQAGDAEMNSVFSRYIEELAIGASSLIMIFKPQMLVLGGGLSSAGNLVSDRLQEALDRQFSQLPREYCSIQVRVAQHGNDAGVLGAAALALDNLH